VFRITEVGHEIDHQVSHLAIELSDCELKEMAMPPRAPTSFSPIDCHDSSTNSTCRLRLPVPARLARQLSAF
jgi:hypothetical protein